MKTIDMMGNPCPIPVIETKKALMQDSIDGAIVKVDNIVAVQNLEKMAKGYEYGFSYTEISKDNFEVTVMKDGKAPPPKTIPDQITIPVSGLQKEFVVVISKNFMGGGSEELGKILIKGFIYSLTELPVLPKYVIFFNSGVHLTTQGANTVDDLKKLENKGVGIVSCGTCINFFNLENKLAVGKITDMYGITQYMTSGMNVVNI